MGRYFTHEAIRLGLVGLAAGSAVGYAWRCAGRCRWGAAPFLLAALVAARFSGTSDWVRWDAAVAAGALVILVAGVGGACLLSDPAISWEWVAAGALISAFGVYAGVPETGPALLGGGALTGLAASAVLTRARWAPAAGVGMAAVVGWAALSGAAGRAWAVAGGALCTGLAPWFAVRPLLPASSRSRSPGAWLLGAHSVLVLLAARWIGVVPHAGWQRLAVVVAAGLAVAVATRPRA